MNLSDTVRKLAKDIAELTKLVMNIRATAGGGVTGGQNIGAGGVGVYHSIVANTMRFRTVNAASAQIAVSLDAVNNEVDIELGPHTHQAAGSGGQLDHGLALTGLADDDHTQYLLANGTRALSANWDAGAAAGRTIQVGYLVAGGAIAPLERLHSEGRLALKESTTPSNDAGYGKIWVSSTDGLPYFMDDAGDVCALCGGGGGSGAPGAEFNDYINIFTPPVDGDFSWVNQDTASIDTTYGPIYLLSPAGASGKNIRIKAAPSTPYTITIAFVPLALNVTNPAMGLIFRQSSDGHLHVWQLWSNAATSPWALRSAKFSSPTTLVSQYWSERFWPGKLIWMRIADDGVNRICSISTNGQYWIQCHSIGRTDYITADQVGFFAHADNASYPCGVLLLSWEEG